MQSRQSGVWPGLAGLVTACVLLLTAVEGQREEGKSGKTAGPTIFLLLNILLNIHRTTNE